MYILLSLAFIQFFEFVYISSKWLPVLLIPGSLLTLLYRQCGQGWRAFPHYVLFFQDLCSSNIWCVCNPLRFINWQMLCNWSFDKFKSRWSSSISFLGYGKMPLRVKILKGDEAPESITQNEILELQRDLNLSNNQLHNICQLMKRKGLHTHQILELHKSWKNRT